MDVEPAEASALPAKRYLIDPGIATAILGLDVGLVMRSGDLMGHLLDTFGLAQLRAELAIKKARPRLYHVRQREGRLEIDLLAELAGGRLVGLEVKADASPGPASARHLAALRDRHQEAFVAGVVLHTGPRTLLAGRVRQWLGAFQAASCVTGPMMSNAAIIGLRRGSVIGQRLGLSPHAAGRVRQWLGAVQGGHGHGPLRRRLPLPSEVAALLARGARGTRHIVTIGPS